MKTKVFLLMWLSVFFSLSVLSKEHAKFTAEKESITLYTIPEFFGLSGDLVREYHQLNPDQDFKISIDSVLKIHKIMEENAWLLFLSENSGIDLSNPAWLTLVIGREVIVPVINAENPYLPLLEEKGVSAKKIAEVLLAENPGWGALTGNKSSKAVHIYMPDDSRVCSAVCRFLGINYNCNAASKGKSAHEIIGLVQNDIFAVGFCSLLNFTRYQEQMPDNIKLLPLDKNGNGHLDYHEKIYGNLDDFKRGIWIGKYPAALIRNIYSVSPAQTASKNANAFLSWVITNGQQYFEQSGFSELVYNERNLRLEKLNRQHIILENPETDTAKSKTFLYILLVIFVFVIVSGYIIRNQNKKVAVAKGKNSGYSKYLSTQTLSFPNGLYFDKSHTWVFMKKNGQVKLGVDDFIPHVTGNLTRLIMRKPGDKIKRKDAILTLIQNGKQISIHAPVSGTIREINENLLVEPDAINRSPYKNGWVYIIEPSNWMRETRFFTLGSSYINWINREIDRLKDFLAGSYNAEKHIAFNVVLQEGGQILENPLQNLDPEIWEDFQKHFIETSEMH